MPISNGRNSRRVGALLLCVLMTLAMAACAPATESPDAATPEPSASSAAPDQTPVPSDVPAPTSDPSLYYEPFSPAIKVTTARITDAGLTLPKDMTWEDNVWTKAYAEKLGVTFENAWSGEAGEFPAALDTMIASGTLPDYMVLAYEEFYKLAHQNMLEPIEKQIDTYAMPQVKAALDAYDGAARQVASYDGHLLGITAAPPRDGTMLWYRDDWFAATGKTTPPATFEEVIDLAYEFAGKDSAVEDQKTVGFGLSQLIFMGANEAPLGLEGVFSAYGAYPTQWQLVNGEMIHGSVNPDVKPVLELLQKWYADGIIDEDFDSVDRWEGIAKDGVFAERIGMAFGAEWFGEHFAPTLMNEKQEFSPTWTSIPVPGASGSTNRVPTIARQGSVTCVRAGFAYPELPVKMVNLTQSLLAGELAAPEYRFVVEDNIQRDTSFLMMAAGGHKTDSASAMTSNKGEIATAVLSALSSSAPDTSAFTQDMQYIYDRCLIWEKQDNPNTADYRLFVSFGPNGSQSVLADMRARGLLQPDAYYGPETVNIQDNWATLMELRTEYYTEIIKGADLDSKFDEYVRLFKENGGEACTRDVNNWYDEMMKK